MRAFLLCFFVFAFTIAARSQVSQVRLTEKSVVKDSSGRLYNYAEWSSLISKGHPMRLADPKNPDAGFLITVLTKEQMEERMSRLPKPRESEWFTTGTKASLFKSDDINGNSLNPEDSVGKVIVLNFWFINCGPCRKEIPELNVLVDSFQSTGKVLFYGIALDKKRDIQKFLEKIPFKYTIIDDGRAIAAQYGIRSYPTHVVIDGEGKVYFHTVGLGQNTIYWLRKSIVELLEKG